MFNNATKQERYKRMGKPTKPAEPTGILQAAPERLRPDLVFDAGRIDPVTGSYEAQTQAQRGQLVAEAVATKRVVSANGGSAEPEKRPTGTLLPTDLLKPIPQPIATTRA
jgi:hypothetical protein